MRSRRLSFVHLSGPRRGQVDEVTLPARIGSRPDLAVVVPGTADSHAFVFLRDEEIVVKDEGSGLGLSVDGEAVEEATLRDGDVIELGADGPKLRFRDLSQSHASLAQSLRWARPFGPAHLWSDTSGFLRAVAREARLRTSLPFRLLVAVVLAAGTTVLGFGAWQSHKLRVEVSRLREAVLATENEQRRFRERIDEERRRFDEERRAREKEAQAFRERERELSARLAAAQEGEVKAVRGDLQAARDRLSSLEIERAAAARIIRDYGPGVCLIQGSYVFVDAERRPLRYVLDEAGQPQRRSDGQYFLDALAAGDVHTVDYLGTGFLVDARRGLILTNRHVVEPWWRDAAAQQVVATGARPRVISLRAFFPREKTPFELTVERASDSVDLALARVDLKGRKVPVLPLDRSGRGAVAGRPVVVLGYPAGLEAVLAKAESALVSEIVDASGTNAQRIADGLAARGLIRPSATQGHIGDVTKTDIVFDAQTTHGGSGGPVLDRNGQVIAIEYAVLTTFGGSSFGIPVRHALALLEPRKAKGGG
jgi:S1-C subfamily serine protease